MKQLDACSFDSAGKVVYFHYHAKPSAILVACRYLDCGVRNRLAEREIGCGRFHAAVIGALRNGDTGRRLLLESAGELKPDSGRY